jgi:hypothetical protein
VKRFRAQSGPFEEQLRFSTDEIDEMCLDALRHAGLLPTSPEAIRIERFVEKHFQCRIQYEDLGPDAMGCTVFRENGSIQAVGISTRLDDGSNVSERRVRSTFAHEGGHCLMHSSLFMAGLGQARFNNMEDKHENIDFKARRILCRDGDITAVGKKRGYDGRWWEWQANRAIGGLLLPSGLVRQAVAQFLERSPVTKSPSLPAKMRTLAEKEVAGIFEVNPVVARIRLQEMFPEDNSGQIEF